MSVTSTVLPGTSDLDDTVNFTFRFWSILLDFILVPDLGCVSWKHRKPKYIIDPLPPMKLRSTMLWGNAVLVSIDVQWEGPNMEGDAYLES